MKNTEKLQNTAKGIAKALNVFRIIAIIGSAVLLALTLGLCVVGFTNTFTKIYELYPSELGNIRINFNQHSMAFIDISEELTLKTIYESGKLDILAFELALKTFAAFFQMEIIVIIISFIKPIFDKLSISETPFTLEIKKALKFSFIAITIFAIIESVFVGLIIGGILACVYFMFLYGCELQFNEYTAL